MTTAQDPGRNSGPDPYAVVGATGQQGGATARALLAAGASVRALVRDPDAPAARALAGQGAELVRADLTHPASLRAAFDGVVGVFAMTTFFSERGTEGETADGEAIADAAAGAGVPHVVYSSVDGAERGTGVPHFESKWAVEQYLRAAGVPTSVVRPVFFMENLAPADGVLALPFPVGIPLQLVAVADIGAVAAAVLRDPSLVPPGDAVEIAGDERTAEQIAEVLGVRYQALPVDTLDDGDLRSMFRWLAGTPAYRADFARTRAIAGPVLDLPAWAARTVS